MVVAIILGIVSIVLAAGMVLVPIILFREFEKSHKSIHVANAQRISDLENKLLSHTWQEYQVLQHTPTSADRAAAILHGAGDPDRPPEGYGERLEDVLEQSLRDNGSLLDDDSPIVG